MVVHLCVDCIADPPKSGRARKIVSGKTAKTFRCTTHTRARKAAQKARRRTNAVSRLYGLVRVVLEILRAFQGHRCWVCRRAKVGGKRDLAVDHDHELARQHDHPEDQGCFRCVRGLLCATCNEIILGRYTDEMLLRAIEYRRYPPMQQLRDQGLTEEGWPT